MIARKNSEEFRKAKSQRIQEKVHQILYCDTDSDEHEVYGERFNQIIKRSNLDESRIKIDEDIAKEYRKRIEKKLRGQESLDKSLIFYNILTLLEFQPKNQQTLITEMVGHSTECIMQNLNNLRASGLVIKGEKGYYMLTTYAKKLLLKTK